ncbi:MAG: hypothetical protein EPN88_10780 [Bacteroidetes bacterium]|nr:MAG: hypothetical protein EPN88_10780 [Bacteroidota bacterium]
MKKFILLISLSLLLKSGYGARPHISFFCELPEKEFNELFADSALINELVEMKLSIRIGLHDFNPGRTSTIQRLNKAGVPLVAWLLLPEEEGYWFNMHNGNKAEKRYADFKKWTAENLLKWTGIGIDLEPDIEDGKLAFSHPWKLAWKVYKRLYDNKSLQEGKELYKNLIDKMKADGFRVESYIIPFIYEERIKKTTSVQKLMGIVDLKTDTEIPMLYTSAMNNPGIIPLYHQNGMPVALGSTGGGVKVEGIELAALSWDNLERDLLIASKLTDEILIFCLESSVQKGFLTKIKNLDFNQKTPDISAEIRNQKKTNGLIRIIIVILDNPLLLTIAVVAVISAIIFGIYKLIALILRIFRINKV